jgi:hypothetical protein
MPTQLRPHAPVKPRESALIPIVLTRLPEAGPAYTWQLARTTIISPQTNMSYGPPWAHYLGGYQDRLLGGPLGLPGMRYTTLDGVEHKDYGGEVLG